MQVIYIPPLDLFADLPGSPASGVPVGAGFGYAFYAGQINTLLTTFRLPDTITLDVGLALSILYADDPINANPGKFGFFGATAGQVVSGTSTYDDVNTSSPLNGSTEVTAQLQTANTPGILSLGSITIPTSDLNSLSAGNWCMLRLRRLGNNLINDTHRRRIVVLGIDVSDAS